MAKNPASQCQDRFKGFIGRPSLLWMQQCLMCHVSTSRHDDLWLTSLYIPLNTEPGKKHYFKIIKNGFNKNSKIWGFMILRFYDDLNSILATYSYIEWHEQLLKQPSFLGRLSANIIFSDGFKIINWLLGQT